MISENNFFYEIPKDHFKELTIFPVKTNMSKIYCYFLPKIQPEVLSKQEIYIYKIVIASVKESFLFNWIQQMQYKISTRDFFYLTSTI